MVGATWEDAARLYKSIAHKILSKYECQDQNEPRVYLVHPHDPYMAQAMIDQAGYTHKVFVFAGSLKDNIVILGSLIKHREGVDRVIAKDPADIEFIKKQTYTVTTKVKGEDIITIHKWVNEHGVFDLLPGLPLDGTSDV